MEFIKQSLSLHGISVKKEDLPYIKKVLSTINKAYTPLQKEENLNEEIPITIVDPEVITHG